MTKSPVNKNAKWALAGGSTLMLVIHLFVPGVELDAVALFLVIIALLPFLIPYLKNLKLPGGFEIELKDVKQATEAFESPVEQEAKISASGYLASEAEAEAISSTREAMAGLREVAESDSSLALVGFRIELEKRLRKVAVLNEIKAERRPLGRIVRDLQAKGVLPSHLVGGLDELISLGNRAAHGDSVDKSAALWVLDAGPSILNVLDTLGEGD